MKSKQEEITWVDIFGNEIKRDVYQITGPERDTMKFKNEIDASQCGCG